MKLENMRVSDIEWNVEGKKKFHAVGKKALKDLAEKLGLSKGEFDLRNSKGGDAVTGEIILHSDNVYVQIFSDFSGVLKVLYRSCNGRKDYSGGTNRYANVEDLKSDRFVEKLKGMAV